MITTCVFEQGDTFPKIANAQMGDRRLAVTPAEATVLRATKPVTGRHPAGTGKDPMHCQFRSAC
jgi:hypothetical protein